MRSGFFFATSVWYDIVGKNLLYANETRASVLMWTHVAFYF